MEHVLTEYLIQTCDPEPDYLVNIHRETYLKETMPHMLSGHFQGRLLSFLSKLKAPKSILEIGTFTGYATLCLAEGLVADGKLHTIDIDPERADRVMEYFLHSPYAKQIIQHTGDALDVIPTIREEFDLVFIDADKKNNIAYFEMILPKLSKGGLILLDNVLWKGKVLSETHDKQTQQIHKENQQLASDPRVEKLILPVRDGLYLLRKK